MNAAKTVVVTGGTVRLGSAISTALRQAGWRVLTVSHRHDSGADFIADLADDRGVAGLRDAILLRLGGEYPDALVNNAALFAGDAETLTALDCRAPVALTEWMARRPRGKGAVVNMLDARILRKRVRESAQSAYERSKRRLLEWMLENAPRYADKLRINAVAPGPVLTPTGVREKAGELPLGRRPTADDVAAAVVYLLSAEAVTGAVIPVDAGQHLLPF